MLTFAHLIGFSIFKKFFQFQFEASGFFDEELSALKSTVFGFIEIPREKRSLMIPRDKGVTIVWVREDKRNKRARFVLHSVEAPQTVDDGNDTEKKSLGSLMNEAEQCYVIEKVNLSSFHAEKSKSNNKNFCEILSFILPCKRIDCKGKQLLKRCFNNRAVVNSLIQASTDELLTGIVKLLTAEKLEIFVMHYSRAFHMCYAKAIRSSQNISLLLPLSSADNISPDLVKITHNKRCIRICLGLSLLLMK
ncbi:unnamed protein product [Brugia timori]|uniref:p-granule-associated protein DEPS-1 sixth OB-fold domain-containing protein n=1 Tax=Brugia timori TaxID=42155 RepID=A0A3P7VXI9_9BILA|nr:unnamed protein product [Brugia timori]